MIQTLTALSLDQWQQAVDSCPESTALHHRNWLELLAGQYGFVPRIYALAEAGRRLAAVPFLQTRGLTGARRLVSLPFSDCVPLLPAPPGAVAALCRLICEHEAGAHAAIVIRSGAPLERARCESTQVRHLLATGRSWRDVEAGFDKSILRNLRRARSHALRFDWRADEEAVEIFYRLHVATRRKLGVPVQPHRYFRRLHALMVEPGLASVGVVSRAGRALASVVVLGYKGSMIYKYAASDPGALESRPNDLLIFHAIRRAVEEGKTQFDFGSSEKDQEGLRRFKRKWGALESEIHYAYLSGVPTPGRSRSLPLRVLSFTIRHSPRSVCRGLGEALYRFSQ